MVAKDKSSINDDKQRWEQETLAASLGKTPERKEHFATSSGIDVERVYTPDTSDKGSYHAELGFPGEFPFTRGVQPTMYRSRLWTMRQ
jgi:methylmalonyl-CoA mutase, N-terminal domain